MSRKQHHNAWREANELFLKEHSSEEFLSQHAGDDRYYVLESGVVYQWLHRGTGTLAARPSDIVYVRYSGRLIDGSTFDSNLEAPLPACFVVRDLIMGWQIALTRMRQGDKMHVIIPSKHGYGKQALPGIPAFSTLIFDIELVKLEPR